MATGDELLLAGTMFATIAGYGVPETLLPRRTADIAGCCDNGVDGKERATAGVVIEVNMTGLTGARVGISAGTGTAGGLGTLMGAPKPCIIPGCMGKFDATVGEGALGD